MDWKTDGVNTVALPEGVTAGAGKLALFPVVELLKRDLTARQVCPKCGKDIDQKKLVARCEAGHAITVPLRQFAEGATEVGIPGSALELPEDLRLTGVRVFFKPPSPVRLKHGSKHADRRHADPDDPYEHPRWTDFPIAEFVIPGARAAADLELETHNADLIVAHGQWSSDPAHEDTPLEEVPNG
jgi:hypothetical protein